MNEIFQGYQGYVRIRHLLSGLPDQLDDANNKLTHAHPVQLQGSLPLRSQPVKRSSRIGFVGHTAICPWTMCSGVVVERSSNALALRWIFQAKMLLDIPGNPITVMAQVVLTRSDSMHALQEVYQGSWRCWRWISRPQHFGMGKSSLEALRASPARPAHSGGTILTAISGFVWLNPHGLPTAAFQHT